MMGGAVSGGVHETLSVSYSQEMKASRSLVFFFFFSSRRRHTRSIRDWSSDVCSSDLDHVRIGLTADSNEGGSASNLGAADLTLRKSADSWLKVQTGRSKGLLSPSLRSDDGGFGFHGPDDLSFTGAKAGAYRADLSVGLRDFFKGRDGRFTFYKQSLDAGYSAPGQATIKDTQQYGGTFRIPVTSSLSLAAKGDQKIEDQGLETRALELDVRYKLTEKWTISTGVRNDLRKDHSPVVPLTQIQGERTDAVAQV